MYCKNCLQINPLPRCVEPGADVVLTGISFPNNVNTPLYAILWDISNNRQTLFTIMVDGNGDIIETDGVATPGLNITEAYDLMGHSYELEFTTLGLESVTFSIEGQDTCCVKFTTLKSLVATGDVALTTGTCNA